MTCKAEGATHHNACDCREEHFRQLEKRLKLAEFLAECLSNHEDLDPVEITEIENWRKAAGK